jgi:hypothetical protein
MMMTSESEDKGGMCVNDDKGVPVQVYLRIERFHRNVSGRYRYPSTYLVILGGYLHR